MAAGTLGPVAIRLVLTDLELGLDDVVECRQLTGGADPGSAAPAEVLVVSADEAVLAEAGHRGLHRLVPTTPEATAAAVAELCRELAGSDPTRVPPIAIPRAGE